MRHAIVLSPLVVAALGTGCDTGPRGPLTVPARQRQQPPATGTPLAKVNGEWVEPEFIPPTAVPVPGRPGRD